MLPVLIDAGVVMFLVYSSHRFATEFNDQSLNSTGNLEKKDMQL